MMLYRTILTLLGVATPITINGFVTSPQSRARPFLSRTIGTSSSSSSSSLQMQIDDSAWEGSDKKESFPVSHQSESSYSAARRERLHLEESVRSRYLTGDRLHNLRKKVLEMRQEITETQDKNSNSKSDDRVQELQRAILRAQKVDAEFVYSVAMESMEEAEKIGDSDAVEKYREEASEVRSCLPQFNLDGLWVGKYGEHGYEMINVTYAGDTLMAYKVTGDKNVPKGQITFKADLNPLIKERNSELQPIELSEDATRQWGTKHLARYSGMGQVAAEDFTNNQWLDGQLILVGDYFSFAWVPLGHQVFFGRPSAELTLKMLGKQEAQKLKLVGQDETRQMLTRCMEETEILEEDMHVESGYTHAEDSNASMDYYNQEGCFE